MTKQMVQLPNPDESLLLRELNHRVSNDLTCAISTISARAVQSDNVAVKTALLRRRRHLASMRRCSSGAACAGASPARLL